MIVPDKAYNHLISQGWAAYNKKLRPDKATESKGMLQVGRPQGRRPRIKKEIKQESDQR